ncbi:hypothetical protein BVRB_1g005290 [Beta vulgaris subsp. vulgaris]|nr:hypothetical protein BVRB_1g005290 [Beta vulgaris subsp. vulgaris]
MEDFKLFPLNCLLDIVEDMIIFCYTYPLVRKLLHIFYEELQETYVIHRYLIKGCEHSLNLPLSELMPISE